MSLHDLKAFYRWLEEATNEELMARLAAVKEFTVTHNGTEASNVAIGLKGKIEEELLTRLIK